MEEGNRMDGKQLLRMRKKLLCMRLKGGYLLGVEMRSPDQSRDRFVINN